MKSFEKIMKLIKKINNNIINLEKVVQGEKTSGEKGNKGNQVQV